MDWQKSTFSNPSGNSVEVTEGAVGSILLRESENEGAWIETSPARFGAFIRGVKAGEFDHFAD